MGTETSDAEVTALLRAALAVLAGPSAAADDDLIRRAGTGSARSRLRAISGPARERHRGGPAALPLRPRFDPRLPDLLGRLHDGERASLLLVRAFGWPVATVADLFGLDGPTVRADANYASDRLGAALAEGAAPVRVSVGEELDRYGSWLEDRAGHRLRPSATRYTPAAPAAEEPVFTAPADGRGNGATSGWVDTDEGRSGRLSRPVVIGLACVLALAAAFGIFRVVTAPESRTLVAADEDPEGPLLLLPIADTGFEVESGEILSFTIDPLDPSSPVQVLVTATPGDDGVYRSAAVVFVNEEELPAGTNGRTVDTPHGAAIVAGDGTGSTTVYQRRDGYLVTVHGRGTPEDELVGLLDSIDVDGAGNATLPADGPVEVLVDAVAGEGPVMHGSRVIVRAPFGVGPPITVETAMFAAELAPDHVLGSDFERRRVGGADVWHLTGDPEAGTERVLSWQVSPNRMVTVSGLADYEQLADVAESLTLVDREVWDVIVPPPPAD
ncbi:MAG: hypothetical protein S0880_32680 [Actinomycetota bacterium]|nr:hypothetical protein [Actinomycetota bacterium]